MRILITGGTGKLGSVIVAQLAASEHTPRILSRANVAVQPGIEVVQGDLASGAGLAEALIKVDAVIHCASSPARDTYEVDVIGTKNLLEQAARHGIRHVVYVSIIGIDRIPLAYYQYKLAAELAIVESGVPYTLARIAQFHDFVDERLHSLRKIEASPLLITTDAQFQTIDLQDAARYLTDQAAAEAGNQRVNVAGPEINTLEKMARPWLAMQGMERPLAHALAPRAHLAFLEGYRSGYNTAPDHAYGSITWLDFLRTKYSQPA